MRVGQANTALTTEQTRLADAGIKTLMPIASSKTLLELILDNLSAAGFDKVCMVIGTEHLAIREFCVSRGLGVGFAIQDEPLGTADAVLAVEEWVPADELFLVVNSDNLYSVESLSTLRRTNRPAMLAFDREALIEQSNIPAERIAKFATVEIDENNTLRQIVEKPERIKPGARISMNAWLFSSKIFAACRAISPSGRGEYEITDAVQYLIDRHHEDFIAVKTAEGVLDLSNRADIESASRFLGKENAKL